MLVDQRGVEGERVWGHPPPQPAAYRESTTIRVAPAGAVAVSNVHAPRSGPSVKTLPCPMAHRPTSVSSGTIVAPPTYFVSSRIHRIRAVTAAGIGELLVP